MLIIAFWGLKCEYYIVKILLFIERINFINIYIYYYYYFLCIILSFFIVGPFFIEYNFRLNEKNKQLYILFYADIYLFKILIINNYES